MEKTKSKLEELELKVDINQNIIAKKPWKTSIIGGSFWCFKFSMVTSKEGENFGLYFPSSYVPLKWKLFKEYQISIIGSPFSYPYP